jgi:hypothetical protein
MAMRILLSLTAIFISIIAIGQPVNLPKDSTTISAVPRINPDQWEAEHTTAYPGEPEQFFKRADAVLTGKINGYDPSTCFHYIRMYNDNLITRELTPVRIPINDDGTFKASFPLVCPNILSSLSGSATIQAYLEPGRSLEMLIDSEVLRLPELKDKNKNKDIRYGGELGSINRELWAAPEIETEYFYTMADTKTPEEVSELVKTWHAKRMAKIEKYITETNPHPLTRKLLRAKADGITIAELLENEMQLDMNSHSGKEMPLITKEYFAPLQDVMARNDVWSLVNTSMGKISNRIAFCESFHNQGFAEGDTLKTIDGNVMRGTGQNDNEIIFKSRHRLSDRKMAERMKKFAGTGQTPIM